MRIPYCINLPPLYDLECEVDCDLDWQNGEPVVSINAVIMDGVSLFASDEPLHKLLAHRIADKAEDDERVMERLIEGDMVSWRGGIGNPSGRYEAAE